MTTSALLRHGPNHLRVLEAELERWLLEQPAFLEFARLYPGTVLLGVSDLELHASVSNPLTHLVESRRPRLPPAAWSWRSWRWRG